MCTPLIQRHKLVSKSGLPFNTLLKEIRDTVPEKASYVPSKVRRSQILISPKVRSRMQQRNIDARDVHECISTGFRIREGKKHTSASRRGGTRLLKEHEKSNKTLLVELKNEYCSLRVRYTKKKDGKYIIIDSYKKK